MPRSEELHIYLKPGLVQDDALLALWGACVEMGRPQEMFRRLLFKGLEELKRSGEIPQEILDAMEDAPRAPCPRRRSKPRRIRDELPQPEDFGEPIDTVPAENSETTSRTSRLSRAADGDEPLDRPREAREKADFRPPQTPLEQAEPTEDEDIDDYLGASEPERAAVTSDPEDGGRDDDDRADDSEGEDGVTEGTGTGENSDAREDYSFIGNLM